MVLWNGDFSRLDEVTSKAGDSYEWNSSSVLDFLPAKDAVDAKRKFD